MSKRPRSSPEVVYEHSKDHPSQWAAIASIASRIGRSAHTLSSWINRRETDRGQRPGVSTDEHARVKALKREVKALRRANEILRKASVDSAGAELDRVWRANRAVRCHESVEGAAAERAGGRPVHRRACDEGDRAP